MNRQHPELVIDDMEEILFQTVLYRVINKKSTFEKFGGIPSSTEWPAFRKFVSEEMKLSKTDAKREKVFTPAHQVMGETKMIDTMLFVLKKKSRLARSLINAKSLEG